MRQDHAEEMEKNGYLKSYGAVAQTWSDDIIKKWKFNGEKLITDFLVVLLAGCSGEEQTQGTSQDKIVFEYNGITINLNSNAEPIIKELSEPGTFEAEAVLFEAGQNLL